MSYSNRFKYSTVALAVCLFSTSGAQGQDQEASTSAQDTRDIEKIVVTGNRAGRALNKIPGAVNIISQAEIENDIAITADITAMLARTVPGYGGSFQQLDRRGETLRGRTALRLLDGVPQGSPLRDGSRDSVFTDLGLLERIEVINGPSAAEGIGASGGIINYITKTPTKMGTEVTLSTQMRSQFEDDSSSWRLAANFAHKNEDYDLLVALSQAETGIAYSADSETIAIGPSGSDRDSMSDNLFIKLGKDFGANNEQRLEVSHSRFLLECQCNYSILLEDPAFGYHFDNKIPIRSQKVTPPEGKGSFNDFVQTTLVYTNEDFLGGSLWLQAYNAEQAMRFEAERTRSKQEPNFRPFNLNSDGFPIGEYFVEQSEIDSSKEGLRSSWSTSDLFGTDGLDIQIGGDYVKDTVEQRLAISNATWVPPIEYTSFAPFTQLSLDVGDITLTAGVRYEDGRLEVDDYTSSWDNDRRFIQGGEISYADWLPNAGVIWRANDSVSVYASHSKGFSLPNAGIPLRNQRCSNDTSSGGDPSDPISNPFGGIQPDGCPNDPQISVNDIVDLEAIIVDNVEIGASWTGDDMKVSVSLYESSSDFGANLVQNPINQVLELSRKPEEIRGFELTASYELNSNLRFSALYSTITGKTTSQSDGSGPLDKELGVFVVPPNKLVLNTDWRLSDDTSLVLGSTTSFSRHINQGKSGEENIGGFTLLSLIASHDIGGGTVTLGVDNLLDKLYLLPTSNVLFYQNYSYGRGREASLGYSITF
jgi:iron complex outermembrane receptor protein